MGERFPTEHQVDDIIFDVQHELDEGLYSEEQRNKLVKKLITALTITGNPRAKEKINELMVVLME